MVFAILNFQYIQKPSTEGANNVQRNVVKYIERGRTVFANYQKTQLFPSQWEWFLKVWGIMKMIKWIALQHFKNIRYKEESWLSFAQQLESIIVIQLYFGIDCLKVEF